jgi:hypothetical protein
LIRMMVSAPLLLLETDITLLMPLIIPVNMPPHVTNAC